MVDTIASEQNPFEAWSKLIERTMKGNPAMPTTVERVQESENDSWLTLIDQFWQTNPYSKLIPLHAAEMIRALQHIWLDAVRNPDRAWATNTDFVQQYARVMTAPGLTFQGRGQEAEPVITAEKGDKRSAPQIGSRIPFSMRSNKPICLLLRRC